MPPKADAVDKPDFSIEVLDRRLQNPFGEPSQPIHLKDKSLVCRWFNAGISADKIWRAKHVKGWQHVTGNMVVDLDQIGAHSLSADGQKIVRGERGQEFLLCMPRDAFDKIQAAKARMNNELMGNPNRQADAAIEAGARAGLDPSRAGGRPTGRVTTSYERIEVRPELQD